MKLGDTVKPLGVPSTFQEREKRFNDVVSLKKPDRVPIASFTTFYFARYAGLTSAEAMYNYEKMAQAWKWSMQRLNWDMSPLNMSLFPGRVGEIMKATTFKWPGYNIGENSSYQYIEGEYMMADEYDELIRDPGSFTVCKALPRMSEVLKPLAMLPPLSTFAQGYSMFTTIPLFASMPGFPEMLDALSRAGKEMQHYNMVQFGLVHDLATMGYPQISGSVGMAAFDWLCVLLRGLKGTMLDIYRQPAKLKAALEAMTPATIGSVVGAAKMSGNPRVFIPLWRGASAFMSDKQFAEFYWPSLKTLLLGLISAGLVPMPWFEGDYTPRLKYLAELPPGKVAGHFDKIDKQQFKNILGKTMCFWGDIPPALLVTGKPGQVIDYVKMLIETFGDTGTLMIDGAVEGIPSESPPENVDAMTEAVFEYGVY